MGGASFVVSGQGFRFPDCHPFFPSVHGTRHSLHLQPRPNLKQNQNHRIVNSTGGDEKGEGRRYDRDGRVGLYDDRYQGSTYDGGSRPFGGGGGSASSLAA